jgi:hypothetical protein
MNSRRLFLAQLSAFVIAGPTAVRAEVAAPLVQVYKSATCGCCSKWVDHLRAAGFAVEATNVPDVNLYKLEYGVPPRLASCHPAVVEGYVVEGLLERLLGPVGRHNDYYFFSMKHCILRTPSA